MEQTLKAGLEALNLPLSQGIQATLCTFGRDVIAQNQVMNLTAITEPEKVARLHLLDSLTLLKVLPLGGKKVIDVGCGAGFPGVPLKIAEPAMDLTALDSLGKRMTWLTSELALLGVEATVLTARAEERSDLREQFDIAVSRAVARLNILLELTAPFVKVGGYVLAMKGTAAAQELSECGRAMEKLGLQVERVEQFPIEDTAHCVIVLKKVKTTPAGYPRRYAKIKANPL